VAAEPAPGSREGASGDVVAELVRKADRDRYLATLFAPEPHRPALLALYAFSAEVSRVRDVVSEPLPGEMRLQFWRDLIESDGLDNSGHPVAQALGAAIARYALPRKALLDLIDARTFDLYDDLMPSVGDLEGYCGETSSALMRLASIILAEGRDPGGADAVGHAGVAYALSGILRALPWATGRGQVFLPADLMERHGVSREALLARQVGEPLRAVLAELRMLARRHLATARAASPALSPAVRTAMLPMALVEPYLGALERAAANPFIAPADIAPLRRIWTLWRASRQAR
jgi:15-cis-phytoene synthase